MHGIFRSTFPMRISLLFLFTFQLLSEGVVDRSFAADPPKTVTLEEALSSKQDLWALEAMRQTNGASYEFFADLLPPLRYVNAEFRQYPIVLCAPGSLQKARLISNGSGINSRANLNTWAEVGTPVSFFVETEETPFGEKLDALDGPYYERGYLPIVRMDYRSGETTYREETFASVDFTANALLFTQFSLTRGKSGTVFARIESKSSLHRSGNSICDDKDLVLVSFDKSWRWNAQKKILTAEISGRTKATLTIATVPMGFDKTPGASDFDPQKTKCITTWENLLSKAMRVEVPEPIVNAAWRSTIIGNLLLQRGNDMNYSAGNIYETMYEAESGDAVRAMMLWGMSEEGRKMIPPLLDYGVNPGLRFHDAAFKLQLLAHQYWLTRDEKFFLEQKKRWTSCVEILTNERDASNGLLPREAYCGDEADKVFSLNSNANGWRGLRDVAAVLEQIGEEAEAKKIRGVADKLHEAILVAVEKSEYRDTQPPFIPIALFGEEKPYEMITATRRGAYWNLLIPYILSSEIFAGTERETSILRYVEEHGGLCMGMIRFHQHSGLFANEDGLDDLYGLRYVDALLRRDEPERAIVSFYGKLAQGMTRETFLSAEGTGLRPLDKFGRAMYLPPTCSGNALFLWQLRSMLVQDYDLDHNCEPETLRLLFATPRRWLENGKTISVENAPTSFGEVSIRVESKLKRGEVIAKLKMPERNVAKETLLRIRLPEGWKIDLAKTKSETLKVDENGTVNISKLKGENTIRFKTSKVAR